MWVYLLLALILLLLAGLVILALRPRAAPSPPAVAPSIEVSSREEARQLADQRGKELLERRALLDARRGALFGMTGVDEAFTQLEERLARGEMTPEEFELEKIRLLGGYL